MNWSISLVEFEQLPYRDDIVGDYIYDQMYRAKAYPNLIFKFVGKPNRPEWWVFRVEGMA